MSHTTKIKGDPGINIDIEIRRNRAFTVNWKHFSDDSHTVPYDIEDVFRLIVKPTPDSADSEAIIDVTSAGALSIDGHVISYSFTAENTNQDRTQLWYELINTTSGQNWYQGFMPIKRGKASDDLETDVESTINVGDVTIETEMTVSAGGGTDFSDLTTEELQQLSASMNAATSFDYDLDFYIQ